MYAKKATIYKMVSTNTLGIVSSTRQDVKEIRVSPIQGLNRAEAMKNYGIDKNIVGQVFTNAFDAETLLNSTYIEIDGMSYYITQIFNYAPTHCILILEGCTNG